MKKCTRCKRIISLEGFALQSSKKGTLRSQCRQCNAELRSEVKTRMRMTIGPKHCAKCLCTKPATEFAVDVGKLDGRKGYCLRCQAEMERLRRQRSATISKSRNDRQKIWQSRNLEKRAAHILVGNAVRSGKLRRQPCAACNAINTQAHHEDYSRPLDVIWLCAECHMRRHRMMRRPESFAEADTVEMAT